MIISEATNSDGRSGLIKQMAEIARPHLLEEAHREAELAAEQHVPEQDAADQRARREHRQLRGAPT